MTRTLLIIGLLLALMACDSERPKSHIEMGQILCDDRGVTTIKNMDFSDSFAYSANWAAIEIDASEIIIGGQIFVRCFQPVWDR